MFKSQSGIGHILLVLILLIGLIGGVYLVQTKTNLFSKAFNNDPSIDELTEQLISLNNQSGGRSAADTSRIAQEVTKASKREELLLSELSEDPAKFTQDATLSQRRSEFPPEVQSHLEESKEIQGEVLKIYEENFDDKFYKEAFVIKDINNQDLKLHLSQPNQEITTGTKIQAQAIVLKDNAVISQANVTQNNITSTKPVLQDLSEKKVAAFFINFKDNQAHSMSDQYLQNVFFSNTDISVNSYYKESSYNNFSLKGEIFKYINLENELTPKSFEDCDQRYVKWINLVRDKASTKVNLAEFNFFVYVFPSMACRWSALGTLSGNPPAVWINGTASMTLLAHELGHNLGMHHANTLSCSHQTIDSYDRCTNTDLKLKQGSEYGDVFNMMGAPIILGGLNAPHRYQLGWIPDSRVKTIIRSGVYTLNVPVESSEPGTQLLVIPKKDTKESYYLSFTNRTGSDKNLPEGMGKGALMYVFKKDPEIRTRLLDMTPDSPLGFYDAAFQDGLTFRDTVNGIEIIQLSHSPTAVSLLIRLYN